MCSNCKYTELYNIPLKRLGEVLEYSANKETLLLIDKVNGMAGSNACRFCSQPAVTKMNLDKSIFNGIFNLLLTEISFRTDQYYCIFTFSIYFRYFTSSE